jgi:hypothetical protein
MVEQPVNSSKPAAICPRAIPAQDLFRMISNMIHVRSNGYLHSPVTRLISTDLKSHLATIVPHG